MVGTTDTMVIGNGSSKWWGLLQLLGDHGDWKWKSNGGDWYPSLVWNVGPPLFIKSNGGDWISSPSIFIIGLECWTWKWESKMVGTTLGFPIHIHHWFGVLDFLYSSSPTVGIGDWKWKSNGGDCSCSN